MKSWELTLRESITDPIDAPEVDLHHFRDLDRSGVEQLLVGDHQIAIGELFRVRTIDARLPTLRIVGDARRIHQIGRHHRLGRFEIDGDVGDHAFASMSGGQAFVRGAAGDFAGSPIGHDRIGMTGGRVVIAGDVGRRCGHRMRRGQIWVDGYAGSGVGSFMIAGTILVACIDDDQDGLGYGMQRGTIVVPKVNPAPASRFSQPTPIRSPAMTLLARSIASGCEGVTSIGQLARKLGEFALVSRGDLVLGGQGEIVAPCPSSAC